MDVRYDPNEGKTTLIFSPKESDRLSLLMQLVIEEERVRGTRVPSFNEDFFRGFAGATEKFTVELKFEYLAFAVIYLDEIIEVMIDDDNDPTDLDSFVEQINEFSSEGHFLQ